MTDPIAAHLAAEMFDSVTPYYQDERVTLYHGDCLELADLWTCADVLVTDPPYGMEYKPRGTYNPATGKSEVPRLSEVAGDSSPAARDAALLEWGELRPAIVFGTWSQPRPAGVRHRLIWWKQGQPPGPANAAFMSQDEEIYIIGDGWRKSSPPQRSVIATSEQRQGSCGEVAKIGHPTPKPVVLMELLIDRCPPGVLADPFAGSGSTLVAARNLGRKAIGVELEERYCEIAANRLRQDVLDFGDPA